MTWLFTTAGLLNLALWVAILIRFRTTKPTRGLWKFGRGPAHPTLAFLPRFADDDTHPRLLEPGDTLTIPHRDVTIHYRYDGTLRLTNAMSAEQLDKQLKTELKEQGLKPQW